MDCDQTKPNPKTGLLDRLRRKLEGQQHPTTKQWMEEPYHFTPFTNGASFNESSKLCSEASPKGILSGLLNESSKLRRGVPPKRSLSICLIPSCRSAFCYSRALCHKRAGCSWRESRRSRARRRRRRRQGRFMYRGRGYTQIRSGKT